MICCILNLCRCSHLLQLMCGNQLSPCQILPEIFYIIFFTLKVAQADFRGLVVLPTTPSSRTTQSGIGFAGLQVSRSRKLHKEQWVLCNHDCNGKQHYQSEVMPIPLSPMLVLFFPLFLCFLPLDFSLSLVNHNPHLFCPIFKVVYIKVTCLLKVMTPLGIKTMWGCLLQITKINKITGLSNYCLSRNWVNPVPKYFATQLSLSSHLLSSKTSVFTGKQNIEKTNQRNIKKHVFSKVYTIGICILQVVFYGQHSGRLKWQQLKLISISLGFKCELVNNGSIKEWHF